MKKNAQVYIDQLIAALVKNGYDVKQNLKVEKIAEVLQIANEKIQYAQFALSKSLEHIENVRDFISSPEKILGSPQTKHGEIAERIEVEIRNGRDILKNVIPTATFDGVGRTAPEDYIIDGTQVQSKFINGANKSLDHVLKHLQNYHGFAENGYYHIPKDQYEVILRIINGNNINDINLRTINKCREIVKQIEHETGKPFLDVVKPGISTYKEVQLGNVDKTLGGYEKEFNEIHRGTVKEISEEKQQKTIEAEQITNPSWGEALKYSAVSAAISGSVSAGIKIYSKVHSGRRISDFTLQDWKDVGYDFAKGSAKGGISGLGIYSMTRVVGLSAPFASSIVSTTMGITSLAYDYKNGKISKSDFSESACSLSVEAGISAIGAAIGQTVIPIPVLGAIVGTATAKASLEISKTVFGNKEEELIRQMQTEYDEIVKTLNSDALKIIKEMDNYYARLDGYINAALSKNSATRFYASIELCRELNVPESDCIHSIKELDNFMLN